jgi:hypothetical protein
VWQRPIGVKTRFAHFWNTCLSSSASTVISCKLNNEYVHILLSA